jgi:hypothetical protein
MSKTRNPTSLEMGFSILKELLTGMMSVVFLLVAMRSASPSSFLV